MSQQCPHCNAELPIIKDAFCAYCGEDLSEATVAKSPTTDGETKPYREQNSSEETLSLEAVPLKRTLMLVGTSALVIALSLLLISLAIAELAVTGDLCSLISGAIILPFPTTLAIQQYRGTFCGVRSAAAASSVILFLFGGFATLAFGITFITVVVDGWEIKWLGLLMPMFVIATVGLFGGLVNWRWRCNLTRYEPIVTWQFSIREILGAMTAICFVTAATSSFISLLKLFQ
ncbi:hypothetical protein N9Y42_00780 [Mariniblastus sp.]|nr:hypothetical protein [Mariniblastus sp.]